MLTEVLLEGLGCGSHVSFSKVPKTAALGAWHLSCQLLLWNPSRALSLPTLPHQGCLSALPPPSHPSHCLNSSPRTSLNP